MHSIESMKEIALHVLDLVENSVRAGAKLVRIEIIADSDLLTVTVADDGEGMDEEFLNRVVEPYTTTKAIEGAGMGIPLFKTATETAGGKFDITSKKGKGTTVKATFQRSNPKCVPLGNLADTMATLLSGDDETDFVLIVSIDGKTFDFDTRELKTAFDGTPVYSPEVLVLVRDMIKLNIMNIGGAKL